MKKLMLTVAVAVFGAVQTASWAAALSGDAFTVAPAPYAKYGDGLLSKTKPRGWIRTFCERQKTGLTGHPEALSYPYDSCLWNGPVISRMGEHGEGWWRYEQTAYYTDGLLRLGYALGDAELIEKGTNGVAYTFNHVSDDGYLGNECLWDATKWELDPGCTLWPMAVFFRAIKAKYEAEPEARIPNLLANFYLKYDAEKISYYRNLIAVEGMLWTARHLANGDKRSQDLVALAESAWAQSSPIGEWRDDTLTPVTSTNDAPLYTHSVTICEQLKIPMLLYVQTGSDEYLDQATNAIRKLVRDHLLPDGCPSSAEHTRGNSVYWGHETCDVTDFTWSLGYALEATGDGRYADLIERCVFNAGLGAVTKDFKTLQYFSNLNQFIATGDSDQNPHMTGSTWQQYRPTHETECCAGNVHRFMPNYVSRMWLVDQNGDPVAALYGPSEVDYGFVRITEETDYPFDGKITFTLAMDEDREFAFSYRVPGWCAQPVVKVNGEAQDAASAGTFGKINRTFRNGDVIELEFPMEVKFERVAPRSYVLKIVTDGSNQRTVRVAGAPGSQGTVVSRGPLLFAYSVPTDCTEDKTVYANMNGKATTNEDFKCWSMRPSGPFNFALARETGTVMTTGAEGYPFDTNAVPVMIEVPVRRIDWSLVDDRCSPDMPESVKPVSDRNETIRLIPYGATCLRLGVFPVMPGAVSIPGGEPWQVGDDVFAVTNGGGALVIYGSGAMSNFTNAADVPWDPASVTQVMVEEGVTLGANSLAALSGEAVVSATETIDAMAGAVCAPSGAISGAEFERIDIVDGKALLDVSVYTSNTLTNENWSVATNGVIEVLAPGKQGFFILKSKASAVSNRSGRPDTADVQHD